MRSSTAWGSRSGRGTGPRSSPAASVSGSRARALQNRPRFLFCDEPTGNLDGKTAADVRRLLWDLNRDEGQTLVVVTHDLTLAGDAHRCVHLTEGRISSAP